MCDCKPLNMLFSGSGRPLIAPKSSYASGFCIDGIYKNL